MLEGHDDQSRELIREPGLRELVLPVEAVRRGEREMALDVVHRIPGCLAIVIARQQHRRAKVDWPAPEPGQHRTLELEALDECRVRRDPDWRDHLIGDKLDRAGLRRVEVELPRRAVQIPWRTVPALAFPLIVVHPEYVAVGAAKLGVDVDHRLHEVVARWNLRETGDGRAEVSSVDDRGLSRREPIDVATEERHTRAADLQPGLALVVPRDHDVNAPCDRLGMRRRRKRDLESERRSWRCRLRARVAHDERLAHDSRQWD